jgi:DNA-binding Xre family transcriptional regulator
MYHPAITSHLAEIMQARKLSIRALADLSGVSHDTIQRARDHRIETVTLHVLARLAGALQVGVKDLFDSSL